MVTKAHHGLKRAKSQDISNMVKTKLNYCFYEEKHVSEEYKTLVKTVAASITSKYFSYFQYNFELR